MKSSTRSTLPVSWDTLEVLVLSVKYGSANKAADHLGVSHTTIGRKLRSLEEALGAKLFERSAGATLKLTDGGKVVLEAATRMADAATDLRRRIDGLDAKLVGDIRITITEGLASFWLIGALQPFIDKNPRLHINWLTANDSRRELSREAEIAVYWFRPEDLNLVSRKLGNIGYSIYTMPHYEMEFGLPTTIEELKGHRFLHYHGYEIHPGLRKWCALMKRYPPSMTIQSTVSTETVLRSGRFITLLPDYAVRVIPEIVRVPIELEISLEVWMAYHEDRRTQARVRAVSAEIARLADMARGTWFMR